MIRAVHVGLVDSLSVQDFILALKRFAARRGMPPVIYSDNAKTFYVSDNFLRKKSGNPLIWKFSAPLASWWRGCWERLIRSVKSALKKSLGKSLVTRSQLETALDEIEASINSRHLTYIGETGNPLTPSHFLLGRSTPMDSVNTREFSGEINDLILRDKYQSHYVDMFWGIWREEYLRNLHPMSLKKPNSDLKIGSVVLVRNETKSRLLWPMGIVTTLFPGKDGHVRVVELKTNKGLICRAVKKLHRLEFLDETDVDQILAPPPPPLIRLRDLVVSLTHLRR